MTTWAATYTSASQLQISGNQTGFFHVTEIVQAMCSGVAVYSSIKDISFDGTHTNITLTQSCLTGSGGNVERGGIWADGVTGNIPPHVHDGDLTGGTGVKGGPAQYQWNPDDPTEIRFKNPDGSWGSWVDIKGTGGATWYMGYADPPSNSLGNDGDLYLVLGEDLS